MAESEILRIVTEHYLTDESFSGIPLDRLLEYRLGSSTDIWTDIENLIRTGKAVLRYGVHGNPHVRHFSSAEGVDAMLAVLAARTTDHVNVFPSSSHLACVLGEERLRDRPYTRQLALGAAQLDARFFDISVLESYRSDPRYQYTTSDWGGTIWLTEVGDLDGDLNPSNRVHLQTFGFAYDDALNRTVAVYCTYLSALSGAHQQLWMAHETSADDVHWLHPEYERTSVHGEWAERVSVFEAFTQELHVINQMARAMGRDALFQHEFAGSHRPRKFGWLLRPTSDEFDAFVLLLDKMMSDNINKAFFGSDVRLVDESTDAEGTRIRTQRGTIALLRDWLTGRFRPPDNKSIDTMIETFKQVRKGRQAPAHRIEPNRFDRRLVQDQIKLMARAYEALRTLRSAMALHPAVTRAGVEVPHHLEQGKVWFF